MLTELMPPAARKAVYLVYGLIGLGLGATQTAYSAAGTSQPTWLVVAFAVFGFLGTGLGIVAAGNTPPSTSVTDLRKPDAGPTGSPFTSH